MTDIIEIRLMWSAALVFFGLIVPLFSLFVWMGFSNSFHNMQERKKKFLLVGFFAYISLFFVYSRDIIPSKYDIKYEKVYQCEYVEVIVPKYPIDEK